MRELTTEKTNDFDWEDDTDFKRYVEHPMLIIIGLGSLIPITMALIGIAIIQLTGGPGP